MGEIIQGLAMSACVALVGWYLLKEYMKNKRLNKIVDQEFKRSAEELKRSTEKKSVEQEELIKAELTFDDGSRATITFTSRKDFNGYMKRVAKTAMYLENKNGGRVFLPHMIEDIEVLEYSKAIKKLERYANRGGSNG